VRWFWRSIRHGYSADCASSGGASRHGTLAPSRFRATARPDRNRSSMEAVAGPGAAKPSVTSSLNFVQLLWAAKAAALYCGCSHIYLPNVSAGSGSNGGLRLTSAACPCRFPAARSSNRSRQRHFGASLTLPAPESSKTPRLACASHQSRIVMQVDGVGRITDRAENRALTFRRHRQHRKCLIAMRGDHDVIVGVASAAAVGDDDAVRGPFDRCHPRNPAASGSGRTRSTCPT